MGFGDSTKMAGNSRLGRGTKPNKRILSDFMDAKGRAQQGHPLKFDSAESFDLELTTEGLVAGCGSLFCGSAVRCLIQAIESVELTPET